MSNNTNERDNAADMITLAQAANLFTERTAKFSVRRWAHKGVKLPTGERVRLQYRRFGRQSYTTAAWVKEFDARRKGFVETADRFRARIHGDSMAPKFPGGSWVAFRPVDQLEVGQNAYVQRTDGSATFKAVVAIDADTITLRALNTDSHPETITVRRADVAAIAVAEWVMESV